MDLNKSILDAIELVASSIIKKAKYDKTIQAQIIAYTNPDLGEYRCKYQDSTFCAYANDINISFNNGCYVYILVPQGNMNKEKIILGPVRRANLKTVNYEINISQNIKINNTRLEDYINQKIEERMMT